MALLTVSVATAQRMTDKLDRGLVAIKTSGGVFCSWRLLAEEYYDVKFNIYRDGAKLNGDTPLEVTNFVDQSGGSENSQYTVTAVVGGKEGEQSKPATVWAQNYLEITPDHGSLTSTYVPNDACCADVDGDGELEILMKFDNASWAANNYQKAGYNGEYFIIEVYKMNGKKLWWIDLGPNMADFQNNEQNIVAYDWDEDGKAEAVMRASDGTVIHMADGTTQVIGDASKNYLAATSSGQWFVHQGDEYLVYMNGETGKPYVVTEYPLKRLEAGETDLNTAWGDGYGHRSTKHFFGAPCFDGRKASIFLARGIYTRHKMIALDVDPATHQLTERWRWNCNTAGSPWYGQGYHNYAIADVDWDGRDEICFGSMVIDDNGHGLSTTGLGHGDAQHHGDFNPYIHGHEIYACNEDAPDNNYRDATTSKIYYRQTSSNDDGRAMMGNFSNDYPGCLGRSGHDTAISSVTNGHIPQDISFDVNFRIYWDGDLLEETFNGTGTRNSEGRIYKPSTGKTLETLKGSLTNNDTKSTPCYQGDILGDWREEVMMRTADNKIRIYSTTIPTDWRIPTLWHDHQYRQAMVWQMCGYNQPPHVSYFLGELEGITQAPPPLTMTNRIEIKDGETIDNNTHNHKEVILAEAADMTVNLEQTSVSPAVFYDNAPSWVQGNDDNNNITTTYYTHTLTGGAFSGDMRLVKQGDGILKLPKYSGQMFYGPTEVWAGTLVVGQGGLKESPVWLNRFARLESYPDTWGHYDSVKAEYGAVLSPGGANNLGTFSVSDLKLGFGSVLELDVYDKSLMPGIPAGVSELGVDTLEIEKKDWEYGPEYKAPVIRIIPHYAEGQTALPGDKYELIQIVWKVKGSLDDLVIEGLEGVKYYLESETNSDGFTRVNIVIGQTRAPKETTWDGGTDGIWDFANTENFMSAGEKDVFVTGDLVTFTDEASVTDITLSEDVSPASIVFTNSEKDYRLSGNGSIIGKATLTKRGSGSLTIENTNKQTGEVIIEDGTMYVSALADKDGAAYGNLGGASTSIILNGGTLAPTNTIVTSQYIRLEDKGGTIIVPAGKTFTANSYITSYGKAALHKTGGGTLSGIGSFGAVYIDQGTVLGTESSSWWHIYPDTVVIRSGSLKDPDDIYSYSNNQAIIVVPEGAKASWTLDSRCNYTGKLLGKGDLTVNVTSVRCNMEGDWSQFEGTLNFQHLKTGNYAPSLQWNNNYGLGKATVKGTFENNGMNVIIGRFAENLTVTGSGRTSVRNFCPKVVNSRSGLSYPTLEVEGPLSIFDAINITHSGNSLKAGTVLTLWKAASFSKSDNVVVTLPELPAGLYWDTSELYTKEGRLAVTDVPPTGIREVQTDDDGNSIYTLGGAKVSEPLQKGIYIKNGKKIIIK